MARTFEQQRHERAASRLTVLGSLLIFGALLAALYGIIQHEDETVGSTASYTARQEVNNTVNYYENSFFGTTPRLSSNAYISALTRSITTKFRSTYALTKPAELTYIYRIDAAVKGTYPLGGDSENTSNVWQKDFVLVAPKKQSDTTNVLSVSQDVAVPVQSRLRDNDRFDLAHVDKPI